MADETVESDQIQQRPHKRKHTHDLQSKNRKKWKLPHARGQVKREKSQSVHLGFPKTAAEMSSNWKILLATLQKERKKAEEYGEVKHRSRKTFKTRLKPSESSQKVKSGLMMLIQKILGKSQHQKQLKQLTKICKRLLLLEICSS